MTREQRDERICELRRDGESLRSIARILGINRQTAKDVCDKHGIAPPEPEPPKVVVNVHLPRKHVEAIDEIIIARPVETSRSAIVREAVDAYFRE